MGSPKQSKAERRALAASAKLRHTVNRLYALSLGLLRAQTAFEKYYEEATTLFADGRSDEELAAEIAAAVSGLRATGLIRTGSLLSVHLGLLYAVVEGWGKWGFADPTVDHLLKSPFVKDLQDHRNAIFHVSERTDPHIMQWSLDRTRVKWTQELVGALRAALLSRHAELGVKVAVHLKGGGR